MTAPLLPGEGPSPSSFQRELLGNSPENPLGVQLVGPVAGLIVFAGYLVFRFYDLPDEGEQMVPVQRDRVAEPS